MIPSGRAAQAISTTSLQVLAPYWSGLEQTTLVDVGLAASVVEVVGVAEVVVVGATEEALGVVEATAGSTDDAELAVVVGSMLEGEVVVVASGPVHLNPFIKLGHVFLKSVEVIAADMASLPSAHATDLYEIMCQL